MTQQPEAKNIATISTLEKNCCVAVVLGTLCYYWFVFFHFKTDAGQADDFVDVLWFMEIFLSREHWQNWFAVLALPNHEHVTLINHVIYLLDYALFKKINFFHYMLVGNAILLACCWVLADWLKKYVSWRHASAIAVSVFFNLFYWNASFWAMTAISNQIVILFALLAARSAANNPAAVAAPLCWSLLAIGSQFNGLLVLPALCVGSAWAAYKMGERQNWRKLCIWLSAFLATAALYCWYENPFAADHLWRYVQYTDPAHLQDYIKPSRGQPVTFFSSIEQTFFSYFSVIGATVFGSTQWIAAALVGVLMLAMLLRSSWAAPVKHDAFFLVVLTFVLVSLVLVAIGRGRTFGAEAGLLSRYRLYTSLLLVLLCGSCVSVYAQRWLRNILLVLCVCFQIASLRALNDLAQERNNIQISHYNWLMDGGMGRSQMPFYPHNQDWRLFNAYYQGYYNPYNAIDRRNKPVVLEPVVAADCARINGDTSASRVQAYSKKTRALAVELRLDVPVRTAEAEFLFCGERAYHMTLGTRNIDTKAKHYWPVLVLKKQLPPSQYRVLWWNGDRFELLGNIHFL